MYIKHSIFGYVSPEELIQIRKVDREENDFQNGGGNLSMSALGNSQNSSSNIVNSGTVHTTTA